LSRQSAHSGFFDVLQSVGFIIPKIRQMTSFGSST
jgi:hypothetical protein